VLLSPQRCIAKMLTLYWILMDIFIVIDKFPLNIAGTGGTISTK
jgi:hypothetical protein